MTAIKEEITVSDRILALCKEVPGGVSDKVLQTAMPEIDNRSRAEAINTLLTSGKIDLFKSAEKGLLYRFREVGTAAGAVGGAKGEGAEEKLVYRIIEEAGNKGTWIRDIRIKSSLVQTHLNKVIKSLKSKKLIKEVKSVNSTRKLVYM